MKKRDTKKVREEVIGALFIHNDDEKVGILWSCRRISTLDRNTSDSCAFQFFFQSYSKIKPITVNPDGGTAHPIFWSESRYNNDDCNTTKQVFVYVYYTVIRESFTILDIKVLLFEILTVHCFKTINGTLSMHIDSPSLSHRQSVKYLKINTVYTCVYVLKVNLHRTHAGNIQNVK